MELIDKCVHCGKPKGKHLGEDSRCYVAMVSGGIKFKSITVAAAEKNAVRNLELLIEIKKKISASIWKDNSWDGLILYETIDLAIKDSTPKE